MLTVVEYKGKLFYVIGTVKSHIADITHLVGLRVDTGSFETLYQNNCHFQYFIDDKGHKLDLNLKQIKEKR